MKAGRCVILETLWISQLKHIIADTRKDHAMTDATETITPGSLARGP